MNYMTKCTVEEFIHSLCLDDKFKTDKILVFTNNGLLYDVQILNAAKEFVEKCNANNVGEKTYITFRRWLIHWIKREKQPNYEQTTNGTGIPSAT